MSPGASLGIFLALAFVLLLLGFALQMLKRFAPGATGGRGRLAMQIVQRLSLGPKQGIAVVKIGQRYIAVTVGDGGVNRLFQLEAEEVAAIEAPQLDTTPSAIPSFRNALSSALKGVGIPLAGALLLMCTGGSRALAQPRNASAPATATPFSLVRQVSGAAQNVQASSPAPAGALQRGTPVSSPAPTGTLPRNAPASTSATRGPGATTTRAQQPAGAGAPAGAAAKGAAAPASTASAPLVSAQADLAIAKLAPQMDVRVGGNNGDGFRLSGTVGIVVMMGLLTLLPSLLLMMTSFTRILIVLHFLRTALATQNAPPATLVAAMALLLTGFVMAPTLNAVNNDALQPWMNGQIEQGAMLERGAKPFRAFMLRQTRDHDLQVFVDLSHGTRPATAEQIPLVTLMSAFVTSELRTSFQIGFALFLPFIIIDVVVSSVLMSMGMFMLPPAMISLPFKLLLFVLVDGWTLIVQSLVASFR